MSKRLSYKTLLLERIYMRGNAPVNRKYQPKMDAVLKKMVRDGLLLYKRHAGSKPRTKKYIGPGQSYVTVTDKGRKRIEKFAEIHDKYLEEKYKEI